MKVFHESVEIVKNPDVVHSFRPLDFVCRWGQVHFAHWWSGWAREAVLEESSLWAVFFLWEP